MVSPLSFAGLEVKPAHNMNTLALDHVNKRAEFVMSFTIPFKAVEDPTSQAKCYSPHEVVMAWCASKHYE